MSVSVPRLGVFGGTFDPIHVGHLAVASAAAHALSLDRVLFVVAHVPWQKVGTREIAPSPLRLAMVQAAVAPRPDFEASSIEIDRGGSSYTIDTVETLLGAEAAPRDVEAGRGEAGPEVVLVVGSDVVGDLTTWHRHEELAGLVTLGVIDRPGTVGDEAPAGWNVERVPAPLVDLSSTVLRRRMAAGEPVDFLVPLSALAIWHDYSADPEAWLAQHVGETTAS